MSSTHAPPFLHVESTLAFNALKTSPKTANITASSPPTQTTTNDTYATSATYDFPDGGRFKLNLSGPPFTAFVDGLQGLPDGFLMEINNFIFSNLCNGSIPPPDEAVSAILEKASHIYSRAQQEKRDDTSDSSDDMPTATQGSRLATAALMKQLSLLENQDTRRDGFITKPKDDNLYLWTLHLFFDKPLQSKLSEQGHDSLQLELRFPCDFPYSPPFIRVVAPYVKCRYVLPRGGICMQLFTASGWTPANSIDAVCVQVRAMLLAGVLDIVKESRWKYSYEGAKRDLQSAVRQHGWDDVNIEKTKEKEQGRRKKPKW